jgi:hypothetical protein
LPTAYASADADSESTAMMKPAPRRAAANLLPLAEKFIVAQQVTQEN